jgi:phosphotransferase system enzyme I (PtsI)
MMVLADPDFVGQIKSAIRSNKYNAEAALKEVADSFITIFESMTDNPYMQERAADIKDVTKRVMASLLGVKLPSPALINEEVIIVADDLTPSETAQLDKKYVKAFVTNIGGKTSHSAIMANTLEIPAVLGLGNITALVKDGDLIAASGLTGEVVINPDEATQADFKAAGEAYAAQKAEWAQLKNSETITADGKHFELAANIGTPKDVEGVNDNGSEAIGLYRTEFLYMDSDHFPTEDEQYEAYKAVLEGMNGKPVVVRTMDIGGDKKLPYFQMPEEMNPFLGWRALRISLSEGGNAMFRTQLRALLRASVHGRLRIMFPMVALVSEFRKAKGIYEEEKANLISEGAAVADNIEVGIMVEIPAAAVLADQFAKEVDFFSIGTNDLIQYTMAADRMNQQVSYLYQPYNPSILRLINGVIKASHDAGKWTGMCGAMAGDQTAVPLLMGMGLDEFSMSATSVLQTRSLMKRLDSKKMEELAHKALTETSTVDEVLALVDEYVK